MEPVKYNHSKSAISTYFFCEYAFYKQKILGEQGEIPLVATQGIEMHRYYEMFFTSGVGIDFDYLWDLDVEKYYETEKNEVYCYFMDVLYTLIEDVYRDDTKFYQNLKAFAIWNTKRWREIKYHFKNKEKCRRYFMPRALEEKFLVRHDITPRLMKGFVDARFVSPKIRSRERVRLSDYKTGRVPKGVRDEIDGGTVPAQYSKKLPSKYVLEGNFYCMMYLLKMGYQLKKEDDVYYFFDKSGNKKIDISWLEYEYVFTNAGRVYIARKKANIVSIRSAIKKMQLIDKHIQEYELGLRSFERQPSEYKCPKCSYFLEDCQYNIDKLEADIILSLIIPEDIEINNDFYLVS